MTAQGELGFGYTELRGSNEERFDLKEGRFSASRKFYGPYDDRLNFVVDELFLKVEDSGGNVIFTGPKVHPLLTPAIPTRVTMNGVGTFDASGPEKLIKYNSAFIDIEYDSVDYTTGSGGGGTLYITEEIDATVELHDIPNIRMKVASQDADGNAQNVVFRDQFGDGDFIPGQVYFKKQMPLTARRITFHFLLNPNWNLLESLAGSSNSDDFTWPLTGQVYGPERVVFLNYSARRQFTTDQFPFWQLTVYFAMKQEGGWNSFWIDAAGEYLKIESAVTGGLIHPKANLGAIFLV